MVVCIMRLQEKTAELLKNQNRILEEQTAEIKRHNNKQDRLVEQQRAQEAAHQQALVAQEAAHQQALENEIRLIRIAEQRKTQLLIEKNMTVNEAYDQGYNLNFTSKLSDVFQKNTLDERGHIFQLFFTAPFLIEKLNLAFSDGVFARIYNEFNGESGPGLSFMEKQAEIQGYDAIECLDACIKGESTDWDWGGDGFKKKEYIRYTWSITCPTSIKDVDLKTKDYMCVFNNKPTFAWTVTYELYVFYHIDSDGTLNIKSIEQKNNNALNDSFTLGIKKYLKEHNTEVEKLSRLIGLRKASRSHIFLNLTLLTVMGFIVSSPFLIVWHFFPSFLINHWIIFSIVWIICMCGMFFELYE